MNFAQKAIYTVVMVVIFPFKPATWRWLFLHDMKVQVWLKSGQKVNVFCESFEVKFGESYRFTGLRNFVAFDPKQIVAVRACK